LVDVISKLETSKLITIENFHAISFSSVLHAVRSWEKIREKLNQSVKMKTEESDANEEELFSLLIPRLDKITINENGLSLFLQTAPHNAEIRQDFSWLELQEEVKALSLDPIDESLSRFAKHKPKRFFDIFQNYINKMKANYGDDFEALVLRANPQLFFANSKSSLPLEYKIWMEWLKQWHEQRMYSLLPMDYSRGALRYPVLALSELFRKKVTFIAHSLKDEIIDGMVEMKWKPESKSLLMSYKTRGLSTPHLGVAKVISLSDISMASSAILNSDNFKEDYEGCSSIL
jgi:hypothetical protein